MGITPLREYTSIPYTIGITLYLLYRCQAYTDVKGHVTARSVDESATT